MKNWPAVLVLALCAGCGHSNAVPTAPNVQEFYVDVIVQTDDHGGYQFDDDGRLGAECRLGTRIVSDSQTNSQILESTSRKTRAFLGGCHFEHRLPYEFCALTSVQNDIECKVSRSAAGPGWFVQTDFDIPESGYLHCTIACFDLADTQ